MDKETLRKQIQGFIPFNKEEEKDKELILRCLDKEEDVFSRKNPLVHFTASSWIINKSRDKVLLCFHNIYNSWSWLGGHCDNEIDCLKVAIKEAKEESGLEEFRCLTEGIFSMESLCVNSHIKKGENISSHIHINLTYLLEADDSKPLRIKQDENKGLMWVPIEDIYKLSNEPWFIEHVYKKLNEKLYKLIKENKI